MGAGAGAGLWDGGREGSGHSRGCGEGCGEGVWSGAEGEGRACFRGTARCLVRIRPYWAEVCACTMCLGGRLAWGVGTVLGAGPRVTKAAGGLLASVGLRPRSRQSAVPGIRSHWECPRRPSPGGSGRLVAQGLWGPLVLQVTRDCLRPQALAPALSQRPLAPLRPSSRPVWLSALRPLCPGLRGRLSSQPLTDRAQPAPGVRLPQRAGAGARGQGQGRTCVLASPGRGPVACSSAASTWHLCPREDRPAHRWTKAKEVDIAVLLFKLAIF